MNVYDELGVKPIINAAGTYTIVGGSRMSHETLRDMVNAAEQHVEIPVLQEAVQRKIAEMTKNESAVVCNGAAAGLYLCAVTAIALKLRKKSRFLSREEIAAHEILSMNAHHIPYDFAVKQLGVTEVRVGYPNIQDSMSIEDMESAVNEKTAAIYYFISSPYGLDTPGALSVEQVIALGRKFEVPVIVDAAAQLPPVENLWKFTSNGATAALFSGGKYLKGPQASGLIVGKKNFLEKVQETNFPNYGYGRMLKTGREEIVGLYSALKQYIKSDHNAQKESAEKNVLRILDALKDSCVFKSRRAFPNEAMQPIAFVQVALIKNAKVPSPLDLLCLADKMKEGHPSVFIKPEGDFFYINPMTLTDREVSLVIDKLRTIEKQMLTGGKNVS